MTERALEHYESRRGFAGFMSAHKYEFLLFFVVLAINLALAAGMKYPILTDEYVTMAEGTFLWGADGFALPYSSLMANYYGYGYSVLYGFLYNLGHDMGAVFRDSLILNSFVAAIIPLICFKLCRTYLGIKDLTAFLIALAAGLYPASVTYVKHAMNETVLSLVAWLCLLLLFLIREREHVCVSGVLLSALLGAVSMYAYMTHGRGIVIVAVAFLCLVYTVAAHGEWKGMIYLIVFLGAAALVFMLDSIVKSYLVANFFLRGAGDMANTAERVLSVSMANAFSPENWQRILTGLFGQFFYTMCATMGLLSYGVFAFVKLFAARRKDGPANSSLRFLFFFAFAFMALSLLVGTAFFSGNYVTGEMNRAVYYVYGRYAESACLMVIFAVLAFLANKQHFTVPLYLLSALMFFATMAGGVMILPSKIAGAGGSLSYVMTPSIMPFMGAGTEDAVTGENFVILAVSISVIFFILTVFMARGRPRAAAITLCTVFAFSFACAAAFFTIPASRVRYDAVADCERFAKGTAMLATYYPRLYVLRFPAPLPTVHFAMDNYDVEYYSIDSKGHSALRDVEPDSLLLSSKNEWLDELYSDVWEVKNFAVGEDGPYLWVYGEELMGKLTDMGYECARDSARKRVGMGEDIGIMHGDEVVGEGEEVSVRLKAGGEYAIPIGRRLPGSYVVNIYGRGMDLCDVLVRCGGGAIERYADPAGVNRSSHGKYLIELDGYAHDVEIVIKDNSDESPVRIDTVDITRKESEAVPLSRAWPDLTSSYEMGTQGASPIYSGGNLSFNSSAVKGQTGLLLRPGGSMSLSGVPFEAGEYQAVVDGSTMDGAGIEAINGEVSDVINYGNMVAFTFKTDGSGEVVITLNDTGDGEIVFRGIRVNALKMPTGLTWRRMY